MQKIKEGVSTRKITWIVDMAGNTGKSVLNDLLELDPSYNCILLPIDYSRSFKYIAVNLICEFIDNKGVPPNAILIDAPRDEESRYLHEIYGVLEELNNGRLFASFQGKTIKKRMRRGIPVIVFSNSPPITSSLSNDRLDIKALYRTVDETDVYIQNATVSSNVDMTNSNTITWQNFTETTVVEDTSSELLSDTLLLDMYTNNYIAMMKLREEELRINRKTNIVPGVVKKWSAKQSAPTNKTPEYVLRQAQIKDYKDYKGFRQI